MQERKLINQGVPPEIRDRKMTTYMRKVRQPPSSWLEAADKYEWSDRAEQYDVFQKSQRDLELKQRETKLEDRSWAAANFLFDKVTDMANYPITKQTVIDESNGRVVIIEPVQWKVRDMAALAKTATYMAEFAIQSAQRPKVDLLRALEILVEEGCCPVYVLHQAQKACSNVQMSILEAFQSVSGLDPFGSQDEDMPDLYAEIAAQQRNENYEDHVDA